MVYDTLEQEPLSQVSIMPLETLGCKSTTSRRTKAPMCKSMWIWEVQRWRRLDLGKVLKLLNGNDISV